MKKIAKFLISNFFPNFGKAVRNNRLMTIANSPPQISSDGISFWGAQEYDNYEPNITKVLFELIKRSNVFVNVGANHGIYCLKFSRYLERVYAIEALPQNLKLLMKNVIANNLNERIVIFPVAAGSRESIVTFYGASTGGSLLKGWNQQIDEGTTLPMFTLDFLLYAKLRNVKSLFLIDVEGAEFEVIKGAKNIVEGSQDSVFCVEIPCREFMPEEIFNPNFLSIFNFFFESGFCAWEIDSNGVLRELTKEIVIKYASSSRYEGLMVIFSKSLPL